MTVKLKILNFDLDLNQQLKSFKSIYNNLCETIFVLTPKRFLLFLLLQETKTVSTRI